jgi:hypothetical protein
MAGRARRTPRITTLMGLVMLAAYECAIWVYLQRWEARRSIMYEQRDITQSIMQQAKQDTIAAGHSASKIDIVRPQGTYTAQWTEWLEAWENRGGEKLSLIRATVSGDNGQLWQSSLQPIVVETYGSPLDGPWVDRLLRAYRERGWRYKVSSTPGAEYFRKRQEWIAKEGPITSVPAAPPPVTAGRRTPPYQGVP